MTVVWIMLAAISAALAYPLVRTHRRHREPRIVRCPENGRTASIELDAPYAAMTRTATRSACPRSRHERMALRAQAAVGA